MRETHDRKTAILVTDDPAVETAAREVAKEMGEFLHLSKSSGDATCSAFDASAIDAFAIVDLDAQFSTRAMFNTIAGLLPVVALTRGRKPWLQAMLRRHRVDVSVTKPITREALRAAFQQIEGLHEHPATGDR
jgi:hypothetical protein